MRKLKIGVLISGGGSNLQALIDACDAPDFPAKITHVIANNADAYGITRAKNADISNEIILHKNYQNRQSFDMEIDKSFRHMGVEFICCAGFMRIISAYFINKWQNKIINIHPSLLPKYKGLNTHQRAIDAGDKKHGCSIHFVNAKLDDGMVIAQSQIDILQNDTAAELAKRVLVEEHKLYPQALKLVAEKIINIT